MIPPAPPGYERSAVSGATLDDLDLDTLREYIARRAPTLLEKTTLEAAAARLGLLAPGSAQLSPTVAGLVLFSPWPQVLRGEWSLIAVRVHGTVLSDDLAAREEVDGPLPELLQGALAFVGQHSGSVARPSRPDQTQPEYPADAVREALINGLIHRDYRLTGRVALRIFDDRLEVWSPGGLPAQLELKALVSQGGTSLPRNPLIAAAARTLGLGDQIGRGLPLIRQRSETQTGASCRVQATNASFLVALPSPLARHHEEMGN